MCETKRDSERQESVIKSVQFFLTLILGYVQYMSPFLSSTFSYNETALKFHASSNFILLDDDFLEYIAKYMHEQV